MTVLLVMAVSAVFLFGAGRLYSGYISRKLGMDPTRPTPAVTMADGRDYVATPTPVVFAHHFASIAGAGPIVGPVIAIIYGWLPALLWVLLGGVLIGAVHDYLATYMATREGGQSVATTVRRMLGTGPFLAITVMIVLMLALVCAAFLNLSATALTSMVPFDRMGMDRSQTIFRVEPTKSAAVVGEKTKLGTKEVMVGKEVDANQAYVVFTGTETGKEIRREKIIASSRNQDGREIITAREPMLVVIGGIASMSVVCITIVAPLVGWLYIKKNVAVWKCSLLAVVVCAISITIGVFRPIAFDEVTWKLLLSAYVLVAAGVPVWIFLQSRDFINVHILYVGMAALVATLVVAGLRGADASGLKEGAQLIPALNLTEGNLANGFIWPGLFILIACGAVSGFHSLCAGGTTCKQLTSEKATRQIGYNAMLLESFLAACVIAVFVVGAVKADYISDVHPLKLLGRADLDSNPVLGFAMALGNAAKLAFGVPIVLGALAGMVLLEGFLVTTLDTAVRLTRYLIEEVWRTIFARYDVFAQPVAMREQARDGVEMPIGADGLPVAPSVADQPAAPGKPIHTRGFFRGVCLVLRQYWVNSGLAVALMLAFAMTGGQKALWAIFATSNQLLAALVLSIASLWLLRQGRSFWFALVPAVAMLITTLTSLCLEIAKLIPMLKAEPGKSLPLLIAQVVILCITAYLLVAGVAEAVRFIRARRRVAGPIGRSL